MTGEAKTTDITTSFPAKGFEVQGDGRGYAVALKVLYEPDKVDLDELLGSITATMGQAFAEADRRLGPR